MPDKYFAVAHHFMRLAHFHRKTFYIFWAVELAVFIFVSLLDGYFIFFNDANIKYSSYHNINVEIRQHRVYGKLNKYLTVKQRNNQCYQEQCGLPSEGHYMLDELQFITLNGEDYIKKMCVRNSSCYQNLFDEQIESYLIASRQQKIDEIIHMLWLFIILNSLFYPLMLYAVERQRKEEEMSEIQNQNTDNQSEIAL
ncbi:hypothetical protein ACPWUF_10515 [Bisgaard Taxon 46]